MIKTTVFNTSALHIVALVGCLAFGATESQTSRVLMVHRSMVAVLGAAAAYQKNSAFMTSISETSAFVGIWRADHGEFQIFKFIQKGSYGRIR